MYVTQPKAWLWIKRNTLKRLRFLKTRYRIGVCIFSFVRTIMLSVIKMKRNNKSKNRFIVSNWEPSALTPLTTPMTYMSYSEWDTDYNKWDTNVANETEKHYTTFVSVYNKFVFVFYRTCQLDIGYPYKTGRHAIVTEAHVITLE